MRRLLLGFGFVFRCRLLRLAIFRTSFSSIFVLRRRRGVVRRRRRMSLFFAAASSGGTVGVAVVLRRERHDEEAEVETDRELSGKVEVNEKTRVSFASKRGVR